MPKGIYKHQSGEKASHWKGGKPKCISCGKERQYRKRKTGLCRQCFYKYNTGKNNSSYRHGQSQDNNYWSRKRRNRERNVIGSHTEIEWQRLKKKYSYMCLCCKKFEPEIKLTRDHIIPLSRGGTDYIENIQPLCKSCNSIKYTKIIKFILPTLKEEKEYSKI